MYAVYFGTKLLADKFETMFQAWQHAYLYGCATKGYGEYWVYGSDGYAVSRILRETNSWVYHRN
jgi:hypothetical protein